MGMNTATVHADGTAVVDLDGHRHQLAAPSIDQARQHAMALVVSSARTSGQPVLILATDPSAQHLLEVQPDGTIRPAHRSQRRTSGAAPDTPLRRRRWLLAVAGATTATVAWITIHPWANSGQQPTTTGSSQPLTAGYGHTHPGAVAVVAARPTPPPGNSPVSSRQTRWIAAADWEKTRAARIQQRAQVRAASQNPPAWSALPPIAPAVAPAATQPAVPAAPPAHRPAPPPARASVVIKPDRPSVVVRPDRPGSQTVPDHRLDPTNPDAG